jgi:hypothetical protein
MAFWSAIGQIIEGDVNGNKKADFGPPCANEHVAFSSCYKTLAFFCPPHLERISDFRLERRNPACLAIISLMISGCAQSHMDRHDLS